MNRFEERVLRVMDQFGMAGAGQTVIAAVSGGADSLCMLHVLHRLQPVRKYRLCVAHMNHLLRADAAADAAFVRGEAARRGLTAHIREADVAAYAASHRESVETAGRNLRYRFFEELAAEYGDAVVATAHNANDSAESFFLHLLRGSGLTGLTGIHPVRGRLIRPLLYEPRAEIEAYCRGQGLTPRHDHTNDSDDYRRNDLRHHVLPPVLERCSIESLLRTMEVLAGDDAYLASCAQEQAGRIIREKGGVRTLDAKALNRLPKALQRRVVRIALEDAERQIGLVHVDSVLRLAQQGTGGKQLPLPGGKNVKLQKGVLMIW